MARLLHLFPRTAALGPKQRIDHFHLRDGVIQSPEGRCLAAYGAREVLDHELVLVSLGQRLNGAAAATRCGVVNVYAAGQVMRGVEGDLHANASAGAQYRQVLVWAALCGDGE